MLSKNAHVLQSLESHIPKLWYLSSPEYEVSTPVPSEYAFMPFHPLKPPNWFYSARKMFRVKQVMEWLESDVVPIDSLSAGVLLDSNA
jgi:hypothetical protein